MERNFKKMIKNYLPNIQIIIPSSTWYITQKTHPQANHTQRTKILQPRTIPVE